MTVADAYGNLRALGRPIVETREAASRLNTSLTNTSRILQAAANAGLVVQVRHGLWAIDPGVPRFAVAPYLTAPFPSYVSVWSAMARHGMIEQIPGSVFVVSLDRSKAIRTSFGQFSIHHVAPEVFGGFHGDADTGYLATAEKALFDLVYLRAPRGGEVKLPELTLPSGFDHAEVERWAAAVPRPRLRTLVARHLASILASAEREESA